MTIYLLVFLTTLAADFAWTKYNMASAAKQPHPAAAWSAAIILCGAFNVVAYTANHWLLVPAVLGAYAGTWWAVWRELPKVETCNNPAPSTIPAWRMHESGDRRVPYPGCGCKVCGPLHAEIFCKPMSPAYEGVKRCDHRNCEPVEIDSGITRWSCGAIEG